jgi:hypothetical protein
MGRLLKSLVPVSLIVIVAASVALACETPVYRYAMYRWQPAPYEVYFFHDQPAGEQDQRVQKMLADFERNEGSKANVAVIPVNVAEDPELAAVPPDVKKAWLAREDKKLPSYFISTPYGVALSNEQLDEAKVQALVESPARTSLAAQLETGKLGVFVLLSGNDAKETEATETILKDLVGEVRDGKVSLYVSPSEATAEDEAVENEPTTNEAVTEGSPVATTPQFDLGFIKIDRDDSEEQWFVRSLLAMEPDLQQEQRPMVFLVYGRARALLPYIGKGITRENLVREIEFISGACSCTVKEQNPGVDLLVRYDWDSAAATLAEKFGSEEGNESQLGPEMFFPELIIPDSGSPVATELTSTKSTARELQETAPEATSVDEVEDTNEADNAVQATAAETITNAKPDDSPEVANANSISSSLTDNSPSSSLNSVWIVGVGIGVALLVLFGITFVVLRPQ